MNRKIFAALACACLAASAVMLNGCAKKSADAESVVKVGAVGIAQKSFEAFEKVGSRYPVPLSRRMFPGTRQTVTAMVEAEALYQYVHANDSSAAKAIGDKIAESRDWQWKRLYFISLPYFDLLRTNLGFTDAALEARFKATPDEFKVNVLTEDGRDSLAAPPFEAVKKLVARAVFLEKYPPDSAFLAERRNDGRRHMADQDRDDSSSAVDDWLFKVESRPDEFYMRRLFFEKTGNVYSDSIGQIYGEDKPIVSDDIDVVSAWLDPEQRSTMPIRTRIEWLYKWKIFAEEAEKMGLNAANATDEMLHWASRLEYVNAYIEEEIVPRLRPSEPDKADINIAEILTHDDAGHVGMRTQREVQSKFDVIMRIRVNAGIDSALYAMRQSVGVTFLLDEFRDERDASPATLIATADSLRELDAEYGTQGAAEEAERLYRNIVSHFAFTAEGRRAMGEIAKMMTDRYLATRQENVLLGAINIYRRAQVLEPDRENVCNNFFMVGFAYDEHLKNYGLAEANYKWILRNAPNCALAADAEFMLQHLGEPMPTIEEIQGRSLRQGREVDFGGDDDVS